MQHGYRYTPSDPNVTLENNKRVKNYYREELSAFTNTNVHYLSFLFLMLSQQLQHWPGAGRREQFRCGGSGVLPWGAVVLTSNPFHLPKAGQLVVFQCV